MNIHQFYNLLELQTNAPDLSDIEKITRQYPFFSLSQMIYITYLYKNNDNEFSAVLKKFSHNIPNRKFFFQFLKQNKNTKQKHNKEKTIPTTPAIEQNKPQILTETSETQTNETININEDINKTIVESIIQKELLEINQNIKTKITQLAPTQQESQLTSNKTEANNDINQDTTSTTAPPITKEETSAYSLSHLLKIYTNKEQEKQNIPNTLTSTEALQNKKEKIKQQQEIIDKIISNPPKTTKIMKGKIFSAENKAKESLLETEDLVTETLAQIYASQGNIHKAIRAYEILSLKFPQKNTYFAAKIEELKKLLIK